MPEARNRARNASAATHTWPFYVLFIFSGVAALTYQVIWGRRFAEVFGVTTYAVTAVLAAFLGGLALGSVIFGRIADRMQRPLRLFGWLEIGVGATALAGYWLIDALGPLHVSIANRLPPDSPALVAARILLALLVMLPPTALMGGTLPAITRAFVSELGHLGRRLSLLYALNTGGAVLGCLLTGFWMIRAQGLTGALLVAVALNLAVGTFALLLSARRPGLAPPSPSPAAPQTPDGSRGAGAGLLAVMFLSGFASLGYEVVWTRILVMAVDSSAYAFVTMLATFLIGITLGAAIAGPLVDRLQNLRQLMGWVQCGIAASALAMLWFTARLDPHESLMRLDNLTERWLALAWSRFGTSFLLMAVPTTLIGMTFPIAVRIWAREVGSLGSRLGQMYGINTLGNIVGAGVTGFALIPFVGLQKSVALLAALNILGAIWGLAPRGHSDPVRTALRALPAAACALLAIGLAAWWTPRPFRMFDEIPTDKTFYYKEDRVATVKVIQRRDDAGARLMGIDAIKIAESTGGVDEKQQALAHFPFVLATQPPRRILSIGLGSGILIAEVARHPEVESIECIELSPAVIEAAAYFEEFNRGVLRDPRVRIVNDDGINYLRRSDRQVDAIISDPKSRTGHSGNAPFFSADYYRLCAQHLSESGLMIQWIPLIEPPGDLELIVRTFLSEFPHASFWTLAPYNLFMVGGKQPIVLDATAIAQRLAEPAFERLRSYGWADAASFAFGFMGDAKSAANVLSANGPISSLDRPLLEFYSLTDHAVPPNTRVRQNLSLLGRMRPPAQQTAAISGIDPSQAERLRTAADAWLESMRMFHDPARRDVPAAFARLEVACKLAPEVALLRYSASDAYLRSAEGSNAREAETAIRRSIAFWPTQAAAHEAFGHLKLREKLPGLAVPALLDAARLAPSRQPVRTALGTALCQLGRNDEAEPHLREALRIDPSDATSAVWLARSLAAQRRFADAIAAYDVAIRLQPGNSASHLGRGMALLKQQRFEPALASIREGARLEPENAMVQSVLGDALADAGRTAEAISAFRAALKLKPGLPQAARGIAWVLATAPNPELRNGNEAVQLAESICPPQKCKEPALLDALAAAYAEVGRFADAQRVAASAAGFARARNQAELADQIEARARGYAESRPFRATSQPAAP